MFKEIIATTLMCTAFGTPKLLNNNIETQVNDTPSVTYRTDNYSDKSSTLNGTYTLNTTIDYSWQSSLSSNSVLYLVNADYQFDELNTLGTCYVNDNHSHTYVSGICKLWIQINSTNDWYFFQVNIYDSYNNDVEYIGNSNESLSTYNINDILGAFGSAYGDCHLANGDIYFTEPVTLNDLESKVFYTFFHKVDFVSEKNSVFTGMYVLNDNTLSFNDIYMGVYNAPNNSILNYADVSSSYMLYYAVFPSRILDVSITYTGRTNYSANDDSYTYNFYVNADLTLTFADPQDDYNYDIMLVSSNEVMGYNISDFTTAIAKRTCVYFTDSVYLNGFWKYVLNTFFSKVPNRYWTSYTGWYTFNNVINNNTGVFVGSIMANNTLYNGLAWSGGNYVVADLTSVSTNYIYKDLYTNGSWFLDSRRVYLSGVLIPLDVYSQMSANGIFDFIPSVERYDLTELIFAVVDSPIKMLTDLFNVELLGVQFYVAFMGIVSIVLICFILRKII